MMNLFIFMIIIFILIFMLLLNFILSKKSFKNREKSSPFECGFDSMSSNRLPFSLQFYLISMIFLIFDVEISLILPMILSYSYMKYMILMNSTSVYPLVYFLTLVVWLTLLLTVHLQFSKKKCIWTIC